MLGDTWAILGRPCPGPIHPFKKVDYLTLIAWAGTSVGYCSTRITRYVQPEKACLATS